MSKNIKLLLLDTIENLGLVGDVVQVKPGYARNFLLPHGLAEYPTAEKIEALKEARDKAHAELETLRTSRISLIEKLREITVNLVRSCNDRGILYGSITQRDIVDGLAELGYEIETRAVRLAQPFRRVGNYQVNIQFDKEIRTEISIEVMPDRSLEEEMEEMEFDNEGELIIKPKKKAKSKKQDESDPSTEAQDSEMEATAPEQDQ